MSGQFSGTVPDKKAVRNIKKFFYYTPVEFFLYFKSRELKKNFPEITSRKSHNHNYNKNHNIMHKRRHIA